MINREAIFAALFATVAGVPGFNTTSRKLKHWSDVAPADQPALFMTQGRETAIAPYRQPTKWTLRASLYVYAHQNSLDVLPSTALNQLIDAIEKALAPGYDGEQTLGLIAQTPAFARNSIATYTDVNAALQTALANVLRNAHYVNGVLQPPLIEPASTNSARWSSDATNAAWTKVGCTPSLTVGPDGLANSASLLTTTATPAQAYTPGAACGGGTQQSLSGFVRAGSTGWAWVGDDRDAVFHRAWINLATGAVGTTIGCTCVTELLANGWIRWKIAFTTTNAITPRVIAAPATANGATASTIGDTVSIAIHQHELNTAAATSAIVTGNTAVTRAADIDQMLAATANGYSRQLGSFLDDKFSVGMKIAPVGFTQNPPATIKSITDLSIVTDPAPPQLDAALAGRSISFGLPVGSGSVSHCRIAGDIETDEGVLGDQAVAIIPIEIMANV